MTAADPDPSVAALSLIDGGAARVGALVDAQAAARDRIAAGALSLISRTWARVDNPRDPKVIDQTSRAVLTVIQGGQSATANTTAAYLSQTIAALEGEQTSVGAAPGAVTLPESLRGLPADQAQTPYWRPFESWRYWRSQGVPDEDAKARAGTRLLVMADSDLTMGMREGARQTLVDAKDVIGYRRVIHPELSRGGACGLCVAASDRTYHRGNLLPIHARCCCEVLPVTRAHDPGQDLNSAHLAALYDAAGGTTSGAALKKVRFSVVDHGEYGPTLVAA